MIIKSGYFTLGGVDVLVEYTYKPLIPGKLTGAWETCFEDEPEEIEIHSIKYNELELFKNGDGILNDDAVAKIEQQISDYENDK